MAQLRAVDAAERYELLDTIDAPELREAARRALGREHRETHHGAVETFPFPRLFRTRASIRYWRDWAFSAGALLIGAFAPWLGGLWRAIWLAVGVGLLVRARITSHRHRFVESVVEIDPFHISCIWPDGRRDTVSFAEHHVFEDHRANQVLYLRSKTAVVPVSYHLMGIERLVGLIEEYSGRAPEIISPAS